MLHQIEQTQSQTQPNLLLIQSVLEGLTDGILILSETGEWIYHNYYAHCICQQLNPDNSSVQNVPEVIWRNCQALIESRSFYTDQPVIIESEVALSRTQVFRIRARWLILEDSQKPYIAVVLEDRCKSLQNRALAETILYDLTPRQAEVWLLYREGFSYQQIASELYITLNTVKRHLKDIRLKRKMNLDLHQESECVNA